MPLFSKTHQPTRRRRATTARIKKPRRRMPAWIAARINKKRRGS
jgi:hypothetical protein